MSLAVHPTWHRLNGFSWVKWFVVCGMRVVHCLGYNGLSWWLKRNGYLGLEKLCLG